MKVAEQEEARKRRKEEVEKAMKQGKISRLVYRTGKSHPLSWVPLVAWRKASMSPCSCSK